MSVVSLPNRGVVAISGEDRVAFLQGLVTNDVAKVTPDEAVYACLLTAQGKFLHDFFIVADGDHLLLDCEAARRADLMKRLRVYRLRSKVEITDETERFKVMVCHSRESGNPEITYADPRHSDLGYRIISTLDSPVRGNDGGESDGFLKYDRLRISLGAPDGSRDMEPEKALPMENNIAELNGIAWDKGCYMGQELTARMKYRALIKKRLTPVRIEGPTPASGTILMVGDKEIGEMRSSRGDLGLALLRVDFEGEIKTGNTVLHQLPNLSF